MGSFFVGCSACSVMLVLAGADGPGRASRAGWVLSESGWQCPEHAAAPMAELGSDRTAAEPAETPPPAAVSAASDEG